MLAKPYSLVSAFCIFPIVFVVLTHQTHSVATNTFLYGGCSQQKYAPGTPYQNNVNSLLTSIVNSASSTSFDKFKISLPGSGSDDVVYGLFQCRGDVSSSDCRVCVANAVSRLGTLCVDSTAGMLQLEGCFVKYDSVSFLGKQDKSVVLKKCEPSIGYDSNELAERDAVIDFLASGSQYFRTSMNGKVQVVAQCTQDLSAGECQDCLTEAIGRLKNSCGSSFKGDMFLGKCYVRYTDRGEYSKNESSDNEIQKTLAILIGIIAVVAILVVFLSYLSKLSEKKGGK